MIIAFVGFAGSGKDTAGQILYNQGFIREALANPVKDAVSLIFGWSRHQLEGANSVDRQWRETPDEYWSERLGKPFSPRLALQLMGTEERRILKKQQDKPNSNFVITDVRFNNELDRLARLGALIVRIKRGPEPDYYEDALAYNRLEILSKPHLLTITHKSEWDWIGSQHIQRTIENDGTLDDLEEKISALVNECIGVWL